MCEGGEKCIQNVSWETSWEETTWRPYRRWEDTIKMGLRGTECEDVE